MIASFPFFFFFFLINNQYRRLNDFTNHDRLWIKGKEFSIKNLLQSQEVANYFKDGSLAVFRLAPQDYHRYHAPVDGILGEFVAIPGTYYTVNPMAIREKVSGSSIIFQLFFSFFD